MLNCIGEMPDRDAVLSVPGAHLHDYGKAARPGRKLGHVTVTAADDDELTARLVALGSRAQPALLDRARREQRARSRASANPQSASTAPVCSPGNGAGPWISASVREKRGAGAG